MGKKVCGEHSVGSHSAGGTYLEDDREEKDGRERKAARLGKVVVRNIPERRRDGG